MAARVEPVAVVGAGPVGLTAALLLARWRVPVLLLDKRPRREGVGSKAICQQRDVLDVWEAVGAGAAIAESGVTWRRARTFYRDRELFCVDFADPGRSPFPPWVNVSQSTTETVLDRRVGEESLIEVRWGAEAVGFEQHARGVTVRLADGSGVGASYVLACAGAAGDAVREAAGVGFPGRSFADRFLICDIRADLGSWAQERRFYFDPEWNPGRQVLIHPCPQDTYRIDWQVPPDYDPDGDDLDRRVRSIIAERPYQVVWRSVYRFSSRLVERMRAGRVLLLGDCAHLVAPFGARGLNSGVWDAENAAWKLAYVLHGWAPASLLDSYDAERRAAARENLEVTDATMRFLVPQSGTERDWRRHVLEWAGAGDTAALPLINSGRMAEPFWYADSPLTTPDESRPFPGRPPSGQLATPGPGVLVPDARCVVDGQPTRLRALARDGLLALVARPGDAAAAAVALKDACPGPSRVLVVEDVDGADGGLAGALGVRPGEAWLVRPDGHVAAVVPGAEATELRRAARRCVGTGE